jgi:hypothetical protein
MAMAASGAMEILHRVGGQRHGREEFNGAVRS